jgi:hypothetical protein
MLTLRRAWPRGAGHLLLDYGDGEASVAGQWFADRCRLQAVAGETAAGDPGAVAWDPDVGVMLQRRGVDRRLPVLADVLADGAAALVVHRPERRAVVRCTAPDATTYVKVVRPGRALPGATALPGLRVPAVVAAVPHRGLVEHAELAGRTLHDLLGGAASGPGSAAVAVAAFSAAGRAVRALHTSPPPQGASVHRPDDEAAVTARWVHDVIAHGVLDGDDRARAVGALERVQAGLGALAPPPALALLHRDLHDKQVLVAAGEDAGLLDLDTLAAGDPALDVANLLVHLELRVSQSHCRAEVAAAAGDAFVAAYRPASALAQRLGAYAAAARLRLACVYAFRPRWQDLAGALVGLV